MKRLTTLVLFLVVCLLQSYSQPTQHKTNSTYKYLYRLSIEQTRAYFNDPYLFPLESLFNSKIDSCLIDSTFNKELLPVGNYLEAWVSNREFFHSVFSINDVFGDQERIDGVNALVIYNKQGERITDVEVMLNNKRLLPDKNRKAFLLPRKETEALLTIQHGSLQVFEIRKGYPNSYKPSTFKRFWYSISSPRYHSKLREYSGYIALNKPKYLPGDTVMAKAFFTNQKGHPVTRKLIFYIPKSYNSKQLLFSDTVSPTTNGSYLLNIPLTDTFRLNTTYYIEVKELNSKKYAHFPRGDFYYEDYLLDEASYTAASRKNVYDDRDTVTLTLEAYDATGLPLMDGRARLVMRTKDIEDIYNKYVQVADTLWTLDTTLSHTGKLLIQIPQSVFPPANLRVETNITFTNSNNELHTQTLYFSVDKAKQQIKFKEEFGYLSIHSFDTKVNKGILLSYHKTRKLITTDTIELPYHKPINKLTNHYRLIVNDKSYFYSAGSVDEPDPIDAYAFRTVDSVFIGFLNPLKLQVTYSIYKDNKLIHSGTGDSLLFQIKDHSESSFRLSYSYLWEAYLKEESITAQLNPRRLYVTLNEPKEVLPGETVKTKISVKDYKGNPVSGVNMTATSLNGQFKKRDVPDVPIFGPRFKEPKYYAGNALSEPNTLDHSGYMSPAERKQMGVDTLLYYRFVYPDSGIFCYYTKTESTQISPYVVSFGYLDAISMLYIDDQFVFSAMASSDPVYAFKTTPGYHRLKLRTRDRLIMIDSVLVKEGFKLELSFDRRFDHSKNPNIKIMEMPDKLTSGELALHKQHMLQVKIDGRYQDMYFSNEHHVYRLHTGYANSGTLLVGPLTPYQTYLITTTNGYEKEFTFEPGFLYQFAAGNTKMYEKQNLPSLQLSLDLFWNKDILQFGKVALEMKDVIRFTPQIENKIVENYRSFQLVKGNGHLQIEHKNTHQLLGYTLCDQHKPDVCLSANSYRLSQWELPPGSYTLTLFYEDDFFYEDTVTIKNNTTTCILLKNEEIKKAVDPKHKLASTPTNKAPEAYSQSIHNGGIGELRGKMLDAKTKKPLDYGALTLYYSNRIVANVLSDDDGNYIIKNLGPGTYELRATYIGYNPIRIHSIEVQYDHITFINIPMESNDSKELEAVCIVARKPLIDPDGVNKNTKSSKEIMALPQRNANMIANTVAGVDSRAGYQGSRADGTAYYIDGVRVQGASMIPQNAIDRVPMPGEPKEEDWSAGINNVKSIRSDFRDYAYWQPDLVTDANGEASFSNTYPDNITTWKSYVAAMDGKQRSGMAFSSVRSYKKLYTSLSVPRFLLEGDDAVVYGKTLNYSRDSLHVQTVFLMNDKKLSVSDTVIDKVITQTCSISATSTDTITMQYEVALEKGYRDGEREKIPVLKTGMLKTEGSFFILTSDTQILIHSDTNKGPLTVYARAQVLDVLLDEMKLLRNYPYYCNEQSASKLIALLYEKQVKQKLNQRFTNEQELRKLIKRLEESRLSNGLWGWWKSSTEASTWISAHVLHALSLAEKNGYKIQKTNSASPYFTDELSLYPPQKRLEILYMLNESGIPLNYRELIKGLSWDSLSMFEKFELISIRKKLDPSYSISYLLQTKKETWSGAIYWGNSNELLTDNSRTLTLLAYKIIQLDSAASALLPDIARYFLEQRSSTGWRNTYESAKIIDAITPIALNHFSLQEAKPNITLHAGTTSYSIDNFPTQVNIPTAPLVTIDKKGNGLIYFTAYQTYFSKNPPATGSDYKINTYFKKGTETINTLQAGNVITLIAEVNITKKAEFVMIEIPIPAGCTYDNNNGVANYFETHREYAKHKTVIFCESLAPGKHIFKVNLQARFTGNYTLNPARIELMYFPVFNGNTALRKVSIR